MATDTKSVKRYQAGVERALGLFDATNEWADYIAFLSRLLKALQAAPTDAEVPFKDLLAQRLARCLTPALPAGVHQKTLEVYDCIFGLLGPDGLARDLSIFLPGFSHTLSFASLTTRPWFLALYNDHILKLSFTTLRPALKALILSLLPGIEEENSEDFDQIFLTIDALRRICANGIHEDIFWQSLFLSSITSPSRRAGALVYLVRLLPIVGSLEDGAPAGNRAVETSIADVVTPEPGLLFRCFATGLQDDQPLVQRGFLDLLVTHMPLSSPTLQKPESRLDLEILVAAAMSIVLRRDMSLNRRLWAWFFGNDEKADADAMKSPLDASIHIVSPYFTKYGLAAVINSLQKLLRNESAVPSARARPFRLTVSLMDRAAVGGPVVDAVFTELISSLRRYQTSAPTQDAFDEVFRSANVLFDSIDPRKLTRSLISLMRDHEWDLLEFIILNFSMEDVDFSRTHLPALLACLSSVLVGDQIFEKGQIDTAPPGLEKMSMILDLMLDFVSDQGTTVKKPASKQTPLDGLVVTTVDHYLQSGNNGGGKAVPPEMLLRKTAHNIALQLTRCFGISTQDLTLDHLSSAYGKVLRVLPISSRSNGGALIDTLVQCATKMPELGDLSFSFSRNTAFLLEVLTEGDPPSTSLSNDRIVQLLPPLVRHLWGFLRPSMPQYHVESVDLIWALRRVKPELLLVDSTIIDLMSELQSTGHTLEHPSINFSIFWIHTRRSASPSQPVTNGPISPGNDVFSLMEQAIVLAVDRSQDDSNWTTWLSSLQSLDFHFQAVLRRIREEAKEDESLMVGLHRLKKLIQVARATPATWKEFVDDRGPATTISNLALTMITRHEVNEPAAHVSIDILRMIYADSGTVLKPNLIETLTEQLPKTQPESTFQSSLLDALHALMSGSPDGNPPAALLTTLMEGISSPAIESNLDKWITLLCNSIPTYTDASFFANLLKLTACFCKRIQALFSSLKLIYDSDGKSFPHVAKDPEKSITNLLSGLEYILARAHTKVADIMRPGSAGQDSTSTDTGRSRTMANHRLTVVLCMQDAIKACCQMWFWRAPKSVSGLSDTKSFAYMSARLRSKTRRMLEHLLDAEPQECLETIMGIWIDSTKNSSQPSLVMNLLQTLDGARPKFMLPAIFNALYSRTNPSVLDRVQRSTLSVDASALELVAFLIEYVSKLEHDLLEEIWSDCVSFMRDVLANPMPHRQLLLRLLEFLAALCIKMENTTFGEQSRMRRELADVATRLLTAIFTIKPGGMDQGSKPGSRIEDSRLRSRLGAGRGIDILLEILPVMTPILSEGDRLLAVYQGLSTNIIGPSLRSRAFPQTLENNVLALCQSMAKVSTNSKIWKKDMTDSFNDPRLFGSSVAVAENGWLPIVRQLSTVDKTLFGDITSRFVAPATAGIMFGVGASAARTEADKTARTNLRRLSLLLLSQEKDFFATSIGQLLPKIEELLTATAASSPSSATRADIYLLFRAMMLSSAEESLVSVWPVIDSELRKVFEDLRDASEPTLTAQTHLQGAKLLDLLLLLKPEEFQLHEWLFITDTIDAIYPPAGTALTAAADRINFVGKQQFELQALSPSGQRKPWLASELSRQPQASTALLGSFFSQLSIRAFEATYSLEQPDLQACRYDLLADLFSDPESTTDK